LRPAILPGIWGIGAIFGLLGSKATDLFQSEDEEEKEQ
jgi:hypothetical protein